MAFGGGGEGSDLGSWHVLCSDHFVICLTFYVEQYLL